MSENDGEDTLCRSKMFISAKWTICADRSPRGPCRCECIRPCGRYLRTPGLDGTEDSTEVLTGPEDLNADLVRARRGDLDLLDFEGLACAPADGGLALDGLSCGVRHGGREQERREFARERTRASSLGTWTGICSRRGPPEDPVYLLIDANLAPLRADGAMGLWAPGCARHSLAERRGRRFALCGGCRCGTCLGHLLPRVPLPPR